MHALFVEKISTKNIIQRIEYEQSSSGAFQLSKPQFESSEIRFSTSAAAKSSSKSRSVIMSSVSIKSCMSFWLICLPSVSNYFPPVVSGEFLGHVKPRGWGSNLTLTVSTFSWACLSVPYWIVKSQHYYTYVTRSLCTFVTALVGATWLFEWVLQEVWFQGRGQAFQR